MEADDVTGGRQLLQGLIGDAEAFFLLPIPAVLRIIVDLAAKGRQPLRRGPGDIAEAHQANPAVRQLPDTLGHAALLHLHLAPLPDGPVAGDLPAQEHEHQHDGLLRHGTGVAALVVADVYAPRSGSRQIDFVIGHAFGVDQFQLGHSVDQRRRHRCDGVHEQDVRVRVAGKELLHRRVLVPKHQLLLADKGQLRQVFFIPCLGA